MAWTLPRHGSDLVCRQLQLQALGILEVDGVRDAMVLELEGDPATAEAEDVAVPALGGLLIADSQRDVVQALPTGSACPHPTPA